MSLGALFAFYAFATQMYRPVSTFLQVPSQLAAVRGLLKGLNDICDNTTVDTDITTRALFATSPKIEISGLTVKLPNSDSFVIYNYSLRLENGDRLWIQGPNGAGKSTLINVLSTVWPPHSGEVRICGSISWVLQHPIVKQGTLADNITLGRPGIDLRYVEYVLECLGRPIDTWRDGWGTLISGSNSRNDITVLSGGEKQIINIARALATRPQIVFLDEPTTYLSNTAVRGLRKLMSDWDGILVYSCHDSALNGLETYRLPIGHEFALRTNLQ